MNEKDKQQLIEEARKCTKEQLLEMYADEFEESFTLSDLWCKSQEEVYRLNNIIKRLEEDLREMYLTFGEFSEEYTENKIKELKGEDKE